VDLFHKDRTKAVKKGSTQTKMHNSFFKQLFSEKKLVLKKKIGLKNKKGPENPSRPFIYSALILFYNFNLYPSV